MEINNKYISIYPSETIPFQNKNINSKFFNSFLSSLPSTKILSTLATACFSPLSLYLIAL